MTGKELIEQFECGAIPPTSFHHADHVRLAFEYLKSFAPLEALEKFSNALRRYAAGLGKADLYHETITWTYFFLIRERMARMGAVSWEEFAARNADVLVWKGGIVQRLYDKQTLDSQLARAVFVLPDHRPVTCP